MKKTLPFFTVILLALFLLPGCSNRKNDTEKLCASIWESTFNETYLRFTESGKVLTNNETEEESVSFYKLLRGNKMNLYTEEGEELGIILSYRFEEDSLFIGEAEYHPFSENPEGTDGESTDMQ